jgi:hypothetical protein
MITAILFWYYKDVGLCIERLKAIRHYNPDIKVFGLYGGEVDDFAIFNNKLSRYLDDNWCFDLDKSGQWKWRNGDLVIRRWFQCQGARGNWDRIAIIQWDFLLFSSVNELLSQTESNALYLPGLRHIKEVEAFWNWTKQGSEEGEIYQNFANYMRSEKQYTGSFYSMQFVFGVFPFSFLKDFCGEEYLPNGFLEYSMPTLAHAWGYKVVDLPSLRVAWEDSEIEQDQITMSASQIYISPKLIFKNLCSIKGSRAFHPVQYSIPYTRLGILLLVLKKLIRR